MKLEQAVVPRVFTPVTITLESQAEVNYFASLLGGTGEAIDSAFGVNHAESFALYRTLSDLASTVRPRLQYVKIRETY